MQGRRDGPTAPAGLRLQKTSAPPRMPQQVRFLGQTLGDKGEGVRRGTPATEEPLHSRRIEQTCERFARRARA